MHLAGAPTTGGSGRGIDPERAARLVDELGRIEVYAGAVARSVRRAADSIGERIDAVHRFEATAAWAGDWAADVRRRVLALQDRRDRTVAHLTTLLGPLHLLGYQCDPGPDVVRGWFSALHPDDAVWLGRSYPDRFAGLAGAPAEVRFAANRERILRAIPDAEADVERARQALAVVERTQPWYVFEEQALTVAERVARRELTDAETRLESLRAWSDPERQILWWQDDDGGRLIEVVGDLDTARHVTVALPGVTNTPLTYERQHRPNVEALADATAGLDVAVVSFLYDAPDSLAGGMASGPASQGGRELAELMRDLAAVAPSDAHRSVVAHSYGSVTTGHGLTETDLATLVDDVVVLGSPGLGVDHVSDLPEDVRLWAAAADGDLIPFTPFHDRDPASGGFAATRFDTGDAHGHSAYFTDPESLANIAAVVTGQHDDVVVIPQRSEPEPSPSGGGY